MRQVDRQSTVGEIVAKYPRTIQVMNRYKIDYCCGGKDSLEKVLQPWKEEARAIEEELNRVINKYTENNEVVKNWKEESLTQIIDYILETHHRFMNDTLCELNELTYKILKVHFASHGDSLLRLHHTFGLLKTELEAHLVKEEENLFPLIKEFEKTNDQNLKQRIDQFIQNTENEHDAAGDLFKEIEIITEDYTPPHDACFTYKRTFELLDALEKDTFNHIHMENSILFELISSAR
jgi:regulator of cell morphogenesis and NO signaling